MLDLETMGNNSESAIVAIGAVCFDRKSGLGNEFYAEISLESSINAGLKIDASTVLWWLNQSEKARNIFIDNEHADHLVNALHDFEDFLKKNKVNEVWGNGAMFDNTILGNAYKLLGMDIPWKFWNDRCYRTIKNMYPLIELNRVGVHHHALDDAKTQALHLIEILNHIEGK